MECWGTPKGSLKVRIRPFGARDLPRILRMEMACFGDDAWDAEEFRHYRDATAAFLIAKSRNRIAGYCIAEITAPGVGEIQSIAVLPAYQGQGIGATLMRRALAYFRKQGAMRVGLMVRLDNAAAIALYRRFGFARSRTVAAYYADGSAGWRMTLRHPSEETLRERGRSWTVCVS